MEHDTERPENDVKFLDSLSLNGDNVEKSHTMDSMPVGKPIQHKAGHLHVTGEAQYTGISIIFGHFRVKCIYFIANHTHVN